jgi:hypothetical protein
MNSWEMIISLLCRLLLSAAAADGEWRAYVSSLESTHRNCCGLYIEMLMYFLFFGKFKKEKKKSYQFFRFILACFSNGSFLVRFRWQYLH